MRWFKTERAYRVVGLGLMFGALGCGGKAVEDSEPAEPLYSAPRATPASPPIAATPPRPQAEPVPPREQPPSLPPPQIEEGPYLARAAAENVLAANCGQCHGPALTPAQALDGINFIADLDALVEAGLIVPLNSAASRIIVVMQNGSMPPSASGLPPVTEADITTVLSYIDNPRFWPDASPPEVVDAGTATPLVDAGPDAG